MNALSVRILPMDAETEFDGCSAEEVQKQFFLKDLPLPPRCGRYQYRRAGLNAEPGTIVLFQYAAKIIACATLDRVERFDVAEGPYEGALYFDVDSIRVFDPVGTDLVAGIWPEFKRFSHVKWSLDPNGFAEFARKMTTIRTYRESVPLKPAADSFRRGWEEAQRGELSPVDRLWEGIDAE